MTKWESLQERIELVGECWLWRGSINWNGYGVYVYREEGKLKSQGAHRFVYRLLVGEVPKGLVLDHQCDNRHCVNPMHLVPETHRHNVLRGRGPTAVNARKTHCLCGAPYRERREGDRQRNCPTCLKGYQQRYKERRRALCHAGRT